MLIGVVGVSVGIFTLIYPGTTAVALLYIVAAWGVVRGFNDLYYEQEGVRVIKRPPSAFND